MSTDKGPPRHAAWAGLPRRTALGLGLAGLAMPALAQARWTPDRPVRLIIPWPPGGSADAQLRSLAEIATRTLGQPVVVENRAGAGGTLHAVPLMQARPDGYMLGQMHLSVVRRPFLVRATPWDATTDFTHVIGLTGWLFGVAVKASSPIRSWADYLAAARERRGTLTYSTSGIATSNHIAMEDLAAREGVQLTHVPFRGANEGVTAVLGGQVDSIADSSAWAPMVEAGQLRLLCVWSAERAARFPEVPTIRELGHADFVVNSPYGLSGPKGMDPGVVRALHDALKAALDGPENERVRAQFDMPLVYRSSEAFDAFIRERAAYERAMIERLGLRME